MSNDAESGLLFTLANDLTGEQSISFYGDGTFKYRIDTCPGMGGVMEDQQQTGKYEMTDDSITIFETKLDWAYSFPRQDSDEYRPLPDKKFTFQRFAQDNFCVYSGNYGDLRFIDGGVIPDIRGHWKYATGPVSIGQLLCYSSKSDCQARRRG